MTFQEQLGALGADADAEILSRGAALALALAQTTTLRQEKAVLTARVDELEERVFELENPRHT